MQTTSAIAIALLIILGTGICAGVPGAAEAIGIPDLVVNGVSAPSAAVAGGRCSFQATVKNTGDAAAPQFSACFYLSEDMVHDASDISLGRVSVPTLKSGSEKTVTCSASIPSRFEGACYILVKADCSDQVREEDEANNGGVSSLLTVGSRSLPVKLPPTVPTTVPGKEPSPSSQADLVITGISVPFSVAPGSKAAVTATVKNQGEASAAASSVSLYLSDDRTIDASDTNAGRIVVSTLGPGAVRTVSSSVRIPNGASGTCYVCARADASGWIRESDEENNAACSIPILVQAGSSGTPTPKPTTSQAITLKQDLVAVSLTSPGTGTSGGFLEVQILVRNDGTSFSRTSSAALYLSQDMVITPGDTYLGLVPVPSLAAGSSATVSGAVIIPATLSPGTYYCGSILDHANGLAEADEGNNIACSPAPVLITTTLPGQSVEAQVEAAIFRYTNQERIAAGVPPLVQNAVLTTVARAHSLDMRARNFFSHTNPDRISPFQRMEAAGYPYLSAAENIAASSSHTLTSNPDEVGRHFVQDLWMNSRGHRESLLSPKYTEIGIGVVYDPDKSASPYGFIATQDFGRRE